MLDRTAVTNLIGRLKTEGVVTPRQHAAVATAAAKLNPTRKYSCRELRELGVLTGLPPHIVEKNFRSAEIEAARQLGKPKPEEVSTR